MGNITSIMSQNLKPKYPSCHTEICETRMQKDGLALSSLQPEISFLKNGMPKHGKY